jgi:hypothetical protein
LNPLAQPALEIFRASGHGWRGDKCAAGDRMAGSGADTAAHGGGQAASASKRDFLKILTIATGAVGTGAIAWPFIDALNPTREALALAKPIVNVGGIAENTALRFVWLGQPIYIRKLNAKQIADNEFVVPDSLPDPASYTQRVKPGFETFVVVVGLQRPLRWLAVPVRWQRLRSAGPGAQRAGAEEPGDSALHLPQRHANPVRLKGFPWRPNKPRSAPGWNPACRSPPPGARR